MLLVGVVLFVTVLVAWDYLRKRRHNKLLDEHGITGPKALPIVGNALDLLAESPETMFDLHNRLIQAHGKTVKMWILHEINILTADAKLFEAIYSSQQAISKSRLYELLHSWLGTGLLLSTGQKWFRRRRIITPTFHFKILDEFVEVFDQQSVTMTKLLYDRADGKTPINMFPVACLAALDIIAETAMGVKVNAQMNSDFPYVKSVTTVSSMTAERLMNPAHRFDGLMRLVAPRSYRKLMAHIKLMHDFTDGVIEERRRTLEKSIADGTYSAISKDDSDMGAKKRMALLDVLLQSHVDGNPLSNADIREEVDTFMFEGHDTTTSGISYTLYLIARHPEVQQLLFEEIRAVIGDNKEKPIGMRELNDLKYLECVIKESLRLYPPVPLIGRSISRDVTLDGKLIPANTNFVMLIYQALRDPDYFPNPDKFDPERFGPNAKHKIDAFAYTPFSAGPRNCIGQKFAMLEMKSTISKMLRHFELLPLGPDVKPLMNIILRSSTGIHVGLKPRVY